jgi:HK97 gp10 family phage protein
MKASVRFEGGKVLVEAMRKLPGEVQKKELVKAVRAGAAVIRDEARSNAPERTGVLRKAIRSTAGKRNGNFATAFVYVRVLTKKAKAKFKRQNPGSEGRDNPNDPFYWRFLEFGTSKITGIKFMRNAFESKKARVVEQVVDALRDGVARAAERLRRKQS